MKLYLAAAVLFSNGFQFCVTAKEYPLKAVRFVVPFSPGGGTDIVARIIGQKLGEIWAQPIVIDNRPGAGSSLGTALVAKSPADGYTFLMNSISLAFETAIYKDLPYDPNRDFSGVSKIAMQPSVIVVQPSLQIKSVNELMLSAKAKPSFINYASGGNGSGPHLATELLLMLGCFKMIHVPYKGTGPALNDLLGGHVQLMIAVMAPALPYITTKRLIGIAVTGNLRSTIAPNIPTVSESGIKEYEFNTWYGIQVPFGTPNVIIKKISFDVVNVLKDVDVINKFNSLGLEASSSTPEEFEEFIRTEVVKWSKVASKIGLIK